MGSARRVKLPARTTRGKIKLGIFDIDGTVFRSSLLIEIVNALVAHGIFPQRAAQKMGREYRAWLDRRGHYDTYLKKIIDIHLRYIVGVKKKDVDRICVLVLKKQWAHVYHFTRDLIEKLRARNYFLVAISGSPDHVVSQFARCMKFDAAFGTLYEVRRGIFTGRVLKDNAWRDKSKVLRAFLKDSGLRADLKNSVAIGDTDGDIPILNLVGGPIALNPNRVLAEHAQKMGWRIIVERKDVMYDIQRFSFL